MCKEGWCVRFGQEGGSLCESEGNYLKYLKGDGIEKREVEKNFKKGAQTGLRRGEGGWLQTMQIF